MAPEMVFFVQLLITGLVVGAVYALVALGFVLIYKASGVINFAQGELMLAGAYIGLLMVVSLNVPFIPALLLTVVLTALLGAGVERVVLRPFIGEPIISVIMATIGLSVALRGLFNVVFGPTTRVFPQIFPLSAIWVGPVAISPIHLWSLILSVALLAVFTLFFKYSTLGIAMRATADDQTAAMSMGISVKRIFAATWAIAAVVAGLGGVLVGNINGVSFFLTAVGLKVIPVVILGGLDSIPGAILGGFIMGVLENLAGGYLDPLVGGGAKDVAPFVALVLILMVRPYGLFGKEIIERV